MDSGRSAGQALNFDPAYREIFGTLSMLSYYVAWLNDCYLNRDELRRKVLVQSRTRTWLNKDREPAWRTYTAYSSNPWLWTKEAAVVAVKVTGWINFIVAVMVMFSRREVCAPFEFLINARLLELVYYLRGCRIFIGSV